MLKVGSGKAFIENIKQLDDCLKKLRLCKVEIEKNTKEIKYYFICDTVVNEELQEKIADYCNNETPQIFSAVNVYISKIVSDKQLVLNKIYKIIETDTPSLLFDFNINDIEIEIFSDFVKYKLHLIKSSVGYCVKNNIISKMNRELELNFCDNFSGEVVLKESSLSTELVSTVVSTKDLSDIQKRFMTVHDIVVIDDIEKPCMATYIEDATETGEVTLCGKITEIRQKTTQSGKPFFIFDFEDGTGKTGGIYFSKKSTLEKIQKLHEGSEIIVRGKIDYYKNKLSLTINKINLCKLPENFVPEAKKGKGVNLEYRLIQPQKIENIKEADFLSVEEPLPECLLKNEFVVFDLETTGTEVEHDEITEIGAVKIVNGIIQESFTTLVKPKQSISEFIFGLTGINDELVKDAPPFAEVVPDFYKFSKDAILVAHNAEFDVKFMKYNAKPLGYIFDNQVMDTLLLSRELVRGVSNYKLNTVAEKFNIKFLHHRALSDAHATGELFIELIKLKKSL